MKNYEVVSNIDGQVVATITVDTNRVVAETPQWILLTGERPTYEDYVAKAAHSGYYWVREQA